MDSNWAGEQLQTIRTLMERSAIYRRALAPIMLVAGTVGVIAAAVGLLGHIDSSRNFCFLWLGTAVVAVIAAVERKRTIVLFSTLTSSGVSNYRGRPSSLSHASSSEAWPRPSWRSCS